MSKGFKVFLFFISIYLVAGVILLLIPITNSMLGIYSFNDIFNYFFWIFRLTLFVLYLGGYLAIIPLTFFAFLVWLSFFLEKKIKVSDITIIISFVILSIIIPGTYFWSEKQYHKTTRINIRLSRCIDSKPGYIKVCAKEVKAIYNITPKEYNKWETKNKELLNDNTRELFREVFITP